MRQQPRRRPARSAAPAAHAATTATRTGRERGGRGMPAQRCHRRRLAGAVGSCRRDVQTSRMMLTVMRHDRCVPYSFSVFCHPYMLVIYAELSPARGTRGPGHRGAASQRRHHAAGLPAGLADQPRSIQAFVSCVGSPAESAAACLQQQPVKTLREPERCARVLCLLVALLEPLGPPGSSRSLQVGRVPPSPLLPALQQARGCWCGRGCRAEADKERSQLLLQAFTAAAAAAAAGRRRSALERRKRQRLAPAGHGCMHIVCLALLRCSDAWRLHCFEMRPYMPVQAAWRGRLRSGRRWRPRHRSRQSLAHELLEQHCSMPAQVFPKHLGRCTAVVLRAVQEADTAQKLRRLHKKVSRNCFCSPVVLA